jgi:hypothetical protein
MPDEKLEVRGLRTITVLMVAVVAFLAYRAVFPAQSYHNLDNCLLLIGIVLVLADIFLGVCITSCQGDARCYAKCLWWYVFIMNISVLFVLIGCAIWA